MKNAIIYTVVFAAIQMMASFGVQAVWTLIYGKDTPLGALGLIIIMAVFSVVTLVVFLWARWAEVSRHWVRTRPWFVLFWCVMAALGALIPSSWLQEQMPELPNIAEQEFDLILKDRMGYLVVGLLAPLVEELVFRGAVLKALLRWKQNAFLIGLLLGWMYYRTDSIVPGVVYHWVNNTVAYIMYNLYPNPDLTLLDLFGSQRAVMMALGFSFCIILPALFQLNLRLKK